MGASTRGVIVRRPTMFRQSLAASTIFEEPSQRDYTIDAVSECPPGGLSQRPNTLARCTSQAAR
jgi:hypothetical protein